MEDARIQFMRFGESIPNAYNDAVFVDIGGRDFDHHHREDFVSASSLVLDTFNLGNDITLKQLADIASNIDHGIFDRRASGNLNLISIIAGLNKLHPKEPIKVMEIIFECLDAIYRQARLSMNPEEEIQKGVKFLTKWGKGIGIETHNREIRKYCHRKGYIVFVYVDPVNQYRGYLAPGGRGVDFSEIYRKVKALEPEAEWYLHFSRDLLICGSDKAVNLRLSQLQLNELIDLARVDV